MSAWGVLATLDPSFTALISVVLGGGLVAAYTAYRRTPAEIESLSVTTMRGVVEDLTKEIDRKDRQIRALEKHSAEQDRVITELRRRIEALEAA